MSSYAKFAAEAGDKYVAALEASQKSFLNYLSATRNWASSAPTVVGPAFKSPSAQEVWTSGFALASKSISQQKDFTRKLFAMITPAAKPAPTAKPAPVAKPATKATVKAAPAATKIAAKQPAAAKPVTAKPRTKTSRAKKK